MKTSKLIYTLAMSAMALTACDKFLDVMPDNRTEIDTQEKVQKLLVSAYPETDYMLITEFMSDNVDDYGENNPNTDRFIDQVFAWDDVTESNNEDPEMLWGSCYSAIAAANQALQSIEDMGGAEATGLQAEMAEALLCRAYSHFILVNVFSMNYDSATASTDLGITWMEEPETALNPKYERNTIAEIYEYIDRDLQIALPLVNDSYYVVAKYHFNQKAAYAFASRFYLYYEKWDQAAKYASLCLGNNPKAYLRDWEAQSKMTQDYEVLTNHYIDHKVNANLILLTAYSNLGLAFGPYSVYSKYAHGNWLATYEDGIALATLLGTNNNGFYYSPMKIYSATNLDKTIFWKLPYLFEYTDPVAQIGYRRTVYPAFTGDQTLLERAEAKTMMKQFDSAAEDINLWLNNISKKTFNFKVEDINEMMKGVNYSQWDTSTVKKHLNPAFEIGEEGSIQENMLQFVLLCKRVDAVGQGLRWFDVKRYGIEIERRRFSMEGIPVEKLDVLPAKDPRRAVQIPKKVIDAGYTPNPR